jgi:hypothetical protein
MLTYDRQAIQVVLSKAPNSLKKWIQRSYERRQLDIKSLLLLSKSKIHLSCDIWTSTNGLSLLGIVAHFVDESGKHQTVLLGLPRLRGSHTGVNIARCLAEVIRKYEIEDKIGCLMMDNASNNDGELIRELAKTISISKRHRLRCSGHILNLVVKALIYGKGIGKFERALIGASDQDKFDLMRKKGPTGKIYNIIKYILRSDPRRQEFADFQLEAALEDQIYDWVELQLLKDGGVRWNATYLMLARALKLRKAIDLYLRAWQRPNSRDAYDLSQDMLTEEDWAQIERLVRLLRPFAKQTVRLEGNPDEEELEGTYGALWETITSMEFLHQKLQAAKISVQGEDDSYFKSGVEMAIQKVNKYFDIMREDSPYYFAAVILHPELKKAYFQDKWRSWPGWIRSAVNSMDKLFNEYVEAETDDDDDIQEDEPVTRRRKVPRRHNDSSDDEFEASLVVDEVYATSLKSRKRIKITSELERYYEAGLKPKGTVPDPLSWWQEKGHHEYPTMAKMAIDLFSIPAMSSECERVFSQAKKMVTDERNRLSAPVIEADQCQKNWLRHELVRSPLLECIQTAGASTAPSYIEFDEDDRVQLARSGVSIQLD